MLRPSYPDVAVGNGFVWKDPNTGAEFRHPILSALYTSVTAYHKANNLKMNNDDFDDNVCRNTPNIVCTEGIRGAGDAIHVILNPIAKGVDALLNTNLQGCGGCRGRQESLNK